MGPLRLISTVAAAVAAATVATAAVVAAPHGAGPVRAERARAGPAVRSPVAAAPLPGRAVANARTSTPVADPRRGAGRDRAETAVVVPPGAVRWRWPVPMGSPVLRPFRAPPNPWGAGHRGLDLGARVGGLVRAVEGGVVTHAGRLAGRGTVTVTHGDGLRSTYEPVSPLVSVGQTVGVGEPVGRLEPGTGHCGFRSCLHLGAVQRTGYLDPWTLLAGGRVRLLPRPP